LEQVQLLDLMDPIQYFPQLLLLVAAGVLDRLVVVQLVALAVVLGVEQVRLVLQVRALLAVQVMLLMLLVAVAVLVLTVVLGREVLAVLAVQAEPVQ
jgi:uncharacterized membrane protein